MDDNSILDLLWNRSEDAIVEIDRKYSMYCLSIINGMLSDDEDVKECLNDTLLAVWNTIPPNHPDNLRVYIGKVARNISVNRLRYLNSKKRNADVVSFHDIENLTISVGNLENNVDEWAFIQIVNAFLTESKRLHRIVFVQKYWYYLTIKQISEINRISESKVLSILYRMRKKLKAKLIREGYKV